MTAAAMGMTSGTSADRPTSPAVGDQFVNGTLGITEVYTENDGWQPLTSSSTGIPYGENADRPANPELGQPFFNADEARLEIYTTATGWQNIVQETPAVVSLNGVYAQGNPSNAITVNGTNFAAGAAAFAVGTNGVEVSADSTVLVSVVELTATFSNLSPEHEPYDIKVVNPSNLYGVLYDTLQIDDIPVFLTQSGSLGIYTEESPISIQIATTDDEGDSLTFTVSSGSLPPGLTLNSSTGEISGTPSTSLASASYSFTITVADANNSATRNFSISIVDRAPTWQTEQNIAERFIKDTPYTKTLVAVDDDAQPVSYSIISGNLPAGLTLSSSTGQISGTPTESITKIFTVRASTPSGEYSDRQFTLKNIEPVWETVSGLITTYMEKDVAYSYALQATEDDTATYSVVSGALPAGLSLNSSTGEISGTPTTSDDSTFTVRVEDLNGEFVDREFTLHVGIKFVTAPGQLTSAFTQFETTHDSSTTPVYSVTAGELPAGMTLSSSGALSGLPELGTYNFTVTAVDALGLTASEDFSIVSADVSTTSTYNYTGSEQTYTVPAAAAEVQFDVYGAAGARGGQGGRTQGIMNMAEVPGGSTLYVYVGGAGSQGVTAAGGYNGGGRAGGNRGNEGSGGGGSDIRFGGNTLDDRIVVAGGGGGGGGYSGASGAAGGGLTANSGASGQGGGGGGGTQTAGGGAGYSNGGSAATAGSFGQGGQGGTSWNAGGGGGGGGWYGGGGGGGDDDDCCADGGGGGGGSSYASATHTSNETLSIGGRSGHGVVTLTSIERVW